MSSQSINMGQIKDSFSRDKVKETYAGNKEAFNLPLIHNTKYVRCFNTKKIKLVSYNSLKAVAEKDQFLAKTKQNESLRKTWFTSSKKQYISNAVECPICLENMSEDLKSYGQCGHSFHIRCIKRHLTKKRDCPLCRKLFLLQDEFPSLL